MVKGLRMVPWGKFLTKREGEDEHESTQGPVHHWHPKEHCAPRAALLELMGPWAQSCSIINYQLSLMPIAQIHRKDPGSLEHRDFIQKDTVRAQPLSWLGSHNLSCKGTGILPKIAQWHRSWEGILPSIHVEVRELREQ